MGVGSSYGEVLRRTFDHPQRQERQIEPDRVLVAEAYVVLEGVDEFMSQHMVCFGVAAGKRHDDTLLDRFGNAPRAFADESPDNIRLVKIGVVRIEDDRLLFLEFPEVRAGMPAVPALGHTPGVANRLFLFGVIVNDEVLGLEVLEVEMIVLDLVSTEVLCAGRRGRQNRTREKNQDICKQGSGSKHRRSR